MWQAVDSRREVTLPKGDVVRAWTEVTALEGPTIVSFTHHYTFPDGHELESDLALRFRSEAEIRNSLLDAELLVIARAR